MTELLASNSKNVGCVLLEFVSFQGQRIWPVGKHEELAHPKFLAILGDPRPHSKIMAFSNCRKLLSAVEDFQGPTFH